MKFKIADNMKFNDRWSSLMRSNENLLSAFHDTLVDSHRLRVLAEDIRQNLKRLLDLVPVKAQISIHKSRYDTFASVASDMNVAVEMEESGVDGWNKVNLVAPYDDIMNLANQFKIGIQWNS